MSWYHSSQARWFSTKHSSHLSRKEIALNAWGSAIVELRLSIGACLINSKSLLLFSCLVTIDYFQIKKIFVRITNIIVIPFLMSQHVITLLLSEMMNVSLNVFALWPPHQLYQTRPTQTYGAGDKISALCTFICLTVVHLNARCNHCRSFGTISTEVKFIWYIRWKRRINLSLGQGARANRYSKHWMSYSRQ